MSFNYQKICQRILDPLAPKQREVIERRFGLTIARGAIARKETLQKIGQDFGLTRERVRQIENEGFSKLQSQKQASDLRGVFEHFAAYIKTQGGAKREDISLRDLGREDFQNQVHFLLSLGMPFQRFPETEDSYPFWALERNIFLSIKQIIDELIKKFESSKKPLDQDCLFEKADHKNLQLAFSALEIAKQIEQGPLGEFGLISWPEIKPRGVKDRAYLALKQAGKPLHFREIAELSGRLGSGTVVGSAKNPVLFQTVHNELIRDERFILVGRGIYGLKEWGYVAGTVKDIIRNILEKDKKPLSREKILEKVLAQRMVKPNTVFLNLSSKDYFEKDAQGRYKLS